MAKRLEPEIAVKREKRAGQPAQADVVRHGWLEHSLAFRLRRAQEASAQAITRPSGDEDLKLGSFALLMLIRENTGINQTALSRASGRDKSTLTTSLRILEHKGFITRAREGSDLRNYTLRLTPAGERELDLLMPIAQAHEDRLRRIVGASKVRAFIETLEKIAHSLEA